MEPIQKESEFKDQLMTDVRLGVFKLNGLLLRNSENKLKDTKLTKARALVLGVVAQSERAMTPSQIAHEMGQSRQGVGRLVAQLVNDGFLQLEENPYHQNSKLVSFTEVGRVMHEESHARHQRLSKEHPFPVTTQDLKITYDTIKAIIAHLESSQEAY